MQRETSNKVQLGENLNPLKDLPKVPAVDNTSDLKDVFRKVKKLGNLWKDGKMDYNLIRYLPGLATISMQGQTDTKFIFTLESSMNKLFESNAKVTAIPRAPDAQNLYLDIPYIFYQ